MPQNVHLMKRPPDRGKVPHKLWSRASQRFLKTVIVPALETAHRDVPLGRLSSSGAELVEGEPGLLPETSWVRTTDSQEALALALEGEGLSFYSALEEKGKKRGEET